MSSAHFPSRDVGSRRTIRIIAVASAKDNPPSTLSRLLEDRNEVLYLDVSPASFLKSYSLSGGRSRDTTARVSVLLRLYESVEWTVEDSDGKDRKSVV